MSWRTATLFSPTSFSFNPDVFFILASSLKNSSHWEAVPPLKNEAHNLSIALFKNDTLLPKDLFKPF
jgi:hypothetical protein